MINVDDPVYSKHIRKHNYLLLHISKAACAAVKAPYITFGLVKVVAKCKQL